MAAAALRPLAVIDNNCGKPVNGHSFRPVINDLYWVAGSTGRRNTFNLRGWR